MSGMSVLESMPIVYGLMILHCIIGGFAAVIAKSKGFHFGKWIILGLIGGTPALIAVCFLRSQQDIQA
jgi:VIT1/CCC1 family predicted Fe2+/Mn2+ transporter